MIPTRTVKFRVTREEEWFPEFDVPADFTDEQALHLIESTQPDAVYDEYLNKYTYDSSTSVSVEPKKIGFLVREVIVTKMFINEEDLGSDPERWESEAEEYFVDTPKEQFSDWSVEEREVIQNAAGDV